MKIKTPLPRFPHGWLFGLVFAVTLHFPAIAQRSGVGSSSVSLPTGPGSIEGLGESYQPALNTGTGKYSIPLKGTPGIGGMMPSLELAYDCGGGNGVLGVGWAFATEAIQRRSDRGIPRYVDGPNGVDDDFDGVIDNPEEVDRITEPSGEDLIPVPDFVHPNVTNYFAKVTGAFIRYRRTNDYWEGVTPTGTRMVYGQSPSARVVDPAIPNHVFQWLLEKEIDTHGNTIQYFYGAFTNDSNRGQKYLLEARWGPGPSPWTNFHFASFTYEDRADWFEDCRSGFVVRTGKRLVQVDMGTQGPALVGHAQGDLNHDGIGDNLIRRYRLAYEPNAFRTALSSLTLIGADGVTSFPAVTFQYTAANTNTTVSAISGMLTSLNEPIYTFENPGVDLIDLNGDGLPDLLRTLTGGSGQYCSLNQGVQVSHPGAIVWTAEQQLLPGADGLARSLDLSDSSTHLADMNGDGLVDLVHVGFDSVEYYPNSPSFSPSMPGWGDRSPMAIQDYPPPAPFGDPDTQTADINFDKRIDIIKSIAVGNGVSYQIWYNLSHLAQPTYSLRQTVTPSTGYLFSGPGVQIVDFNGDRVPDILQIRPTGVKVTAGLGYGTFTDEIMVSLPNAEFLSDDQVAHAHFQDINGDGLADLVIDRAEPGVLWFWLNQGNYTFDSKRFITDLPAPVGNVSTRWADMNGNGTTDLVWADTAKTPHLTIIDIGRLMGAVPRAGMLTQVNNGLGGITQWGYASTVDFMLADGTDSLGNYTYPWAYPLPFPVNVVSNQVVSDSLGNNIETDFAYHDGYYDAVEQEFRGFGRAEEIQVGDATSPTLVTRHFFDVGAAEIAMKGNLLGQSVEQADGSVFSTVTNRWQTVPFAIGFNGVVSRWTAMTNTSETVIELGSGPPKQIQTDYAYDWVGNQTTMNEWGLVEGGNRLAGNDERFTATSFAYNTNEWILRLPFRSSLSDGSGNVIHQVDHFYDDESFSGNNPGQVNLGNPTLVLQWFDATSSTGYVLAKRNLFDSYGNPLVAWDPLADTAHPENGHFAEVGYDTDFHQFPITTTQHIGGGHSDLVTTFVYDPGYGVVTQVTDPNGFTSIVAYDTFSRMVSKIEPGDTDAFPTELIRYVEALSLPGGGLINYVETRSLDRQPGSLSGAPFDAYYHISRGYVDGLGRTRLAKSEAEPDPVAGLPRYVASGGILFGARGVPMVRVEDFFSSTLEYDDISNNGWTGHFHLDGQLVSLGLGPAPSVRYTYDAAGRLIKATQPDGSFASIRYQPLAVLSYDENATDPASPYFGNHLASLNDGLGRQVQTDEVNQTTDDGLPNSGYVTWSTIYQYCADDSLLSITDSQGNVKSMAYDGMGRRTFTDDLDRGRETIRYDDASNVIETVDAKGQHIVYTHDGANRLLTKEYQDGQSSDFSYGLTNDVVFTYDILPDPVDMGDGTTSQATNTLGRLVQVRDTQGDETTAYDQRGRPTWQVRRLPDSSNRQWVAYRTAMEYDPMNRVTKLIYPDNDFITFSYNDRTLLTGISGGPTGSILVSRSFTPSGQQDSSIFGNDVVTRHAYDSRLRLTRTTSGLLLAPDTLMAYQYYYDRASNIQEVDDARPASVLPEGDPRRNTQRFGYDSLYRLTDYQYSTAAPGEPFRKDGEIQNRYDRIGNLLSQTSGIQQTNKGWSVTDLGTLGYGGSQGRFKRTSSSPLTPGPHALTRMQRSRQIRALQYDANGNMTHPNDSAQLTWDFENRLVHYADESAIGDYRYDYAGRRVSKVTSPVGAPRPPPSATLYVSSLFEVRPNDEVVKYVFANGERIAQITGQLNSTNRLQRLRLFPGWNLLSLTLDVHNLTETLQGGSGRPIDGVRIWNSLTKTFDELGGDASAPRGSVLWVHSTLATTVPMPGLDAEPAPVPMQSGGDFLPVPGPMPMAISNAIPSGTPYWQFPGGTNLWIVYGGLSSHPATNAPILAPGSALYVSSSNSLTLSSRLQAPRIRYYHADHLGSQTVVTDETGALVEESAYYPFGQLRNHLSAASDSVAYGFGGKENDDESDLDYFEARYLAADMGRFISVDPLEHNGIPQELNGYSYVGNRPMALVDPSGEYPRKLLNLTRAIERIFRTKAGDAEYERGHQFLTDQETSSGLVLHPDGGGGTTTVIGSYMADTGFLLGGKAHYAPALKSEDWSPRPGGYNLLNVPDDKYYTPREHQKERVYGKDIDKFFADVNGQWLQHAIDRNDKIVVASKPTHTVGTRYGNLTKSANELSGFGNEIALLEANGYRYFPNENEFRKAHKPSDYPRVIPISSNPFNVMHIQHFRKVIPKDIQR